jgi:molybdopterin biosynthesis enzyme
LDGKPFPAEILETAAPGDGLRFSGADFSAGELIVDEGEALRPDQAQFLRLAGIDSVSVRVPRVAIVGRGGSADWIAAMTRREGAHGEILTSGDEFMELNGAADLVVAIGEAGRLALERLAEPQSISSYAAATRPGQTICGIVSPPSVRAGTVFVLTPERIECVFTAWLLLARPCLRDLAGAKACDSRQSLPLTRKIASNPGWTDLALVRRTKLSDRGEAWEPVACADLAWSAIARSDAWLCVAANCEGYAGGQNIFAELL